MSPALAKEATKHPTAKELFDWATGRSKEPSVRQAAEHFGCRQSDIEDAVDAADNDQPLTGAYLGLAVAIGIGSGLYELKGGERLVEAYYTPDADPRLGEPD